MSDLIAFLEQNDIAFTRFDHPPVFTVADVHRLTPDLPGAKTKNLFLRGPKGKRQFLVVVPADKQVDLKSLSKAVGAPRLSFGSPERLQEALGVDPGSVSLFAVFNDRDAQVEVVLDSALWANEKFQFHPLVNTATLIVSREDSERFLESTGHAFQVVDVPERQ